MVFRKNLRFMIAAAAILFVTAIVGVGTLVRWHLSKSVSDFYALWNTTDALQHRIGQGGQWPHNWDALRPSLVYVDPRYSDGDISFLTDRVEINFGVGVEYEPQKDQWYVRLMSGRMQSEQDAANERLRVLLEKMARLRRVDGPSSQ